MGLPSIKITFEEAARTASIRSERGVVGLILRESTIPAGNPFVITSVDDIPATLSAANKQQIEKALIGYTQATQKVVAYLIPAIGSTTYSYSIATVDTGDSPKALGWYEKDQSNNYFASNDTMADSGKTYYTKSTSYSTVTPEEGDNPKTEGWYEKDGDDYFLTEDETVQSGKTYYEGTDSYSAKSSGIDYGDNPTTNGWYEYANGKYTASSDTRVDVNKMYYSRTSSTITTAAITQYEPAFNYFVQKRVNYMAIPTVATESLTTDVATWVKNLHTDPKENSPLVAVLPNTAANSEFVVNYTTTSVTDDDGNVFTAESYCSRIAGILATTPFTRSCSYAVLPELTTCTFLSKSQLDTNIDAGQLVVFYDGEKVKIGRGVNSLTTTTETKSAVYKKIRVVDIMMTIKADIARTAEDSFIGKYSNSYDNKMLLVGAIISYFTRLAAVGALSGGTCAVDAAENKEYLRNKGIDVSTMTDDELLKANTDDQVFLAATIGILDAMEDITLKITI